MSVKVKCPSCEKYMLVESEEIGLPVRCALCSKIFTARPDWMASSPGPSKKPTEQPAEEAPAKSKRKKKEGEKGRDVLEPDPDLAKKPLPEEHVTCPECSKKLPPTTQVCNGCGVNLASGRKLGETTSSSVRRALTVAVVASFLVLLGAGIGMAAKYLSLRWSEEAEKASGEPDEDTQPIPAIKRTPDLAQEPAPEAQPPAPAPKPSAEEKPEKPAPPKPEPPKTAPHKPVSAKPLPLKPPAVPEVPFGDGIVRIKTRRGEGLGFIVDSDRALVATNRCLLEGGKEITVLVFKQGEKEPKEFDRASLAAVHKKADVALVHFEPRGHKLKVIAFGEVAAAKGGEKVLGVLRPSDGDLKMIGGTVMGRKEIGGMACLLTSARVDATGSGGPLLDGQGRAIGVNTYSDLWGEESFTIDGAYVLDLLDNPEKTSLSQQEMDDLLKKGIDPLRQAAGKALLGRTTLDKPATKMATDAKGEVLYVLQPETNSVLLLAQNKVAATIFAGSNPVDFDLSPDGKRLCVAVNQPTGISIVNLEKQARQDLVRVDEEAIFAVRALDHDLALAVCGGIYKPGIRFPQDKEPLVGVKVLLVNLKTGKVEQEIKNECPLPIVKTVSDQIPKKWTKANMDTKREWQEREKFAEQSFAFPVIARTQDGKAFFVASYDEQNSRLTLKDQFIVARYSTARPNRPEAVGPDRIASYVSPDIKEKTINRKKTSTQAVPAQPDFAHFAQVMLVSPDAKTVLLGPSILQGETLQMVGSVKKNEEAESANPALCNIQAALASFQVGFTGADVFDLRTFTRVGPLPFMSATVAVDPEGNRLYLYNPSDTAVYVFNARTLQKPGQ